MLLYYKVNDMECECRYTMLDVYKKIVAVIYGDRVCVCM